jgi:oxygen-independent coproporphyrinogen-3 oxidase
MSTLPAPPLGLYIHLPWCERKCPYCDFNSHETAVLPEARYVDALLADLDQELARCGERAIDSIFIGGGTPSLFSGTALERLLSAIRTRCANAPALEVTMEANPGSAEAGKFSDFRAAGVTRLSLGVQSFDDRSLRALGRIHDARQAHQAIEHARRAGFEYLNLDLMHGLPGQSARAASADLRAALAHQPGHLSWYQLTIEPNTVFHKRPPSLPTEDALAAIGRAGEALLETAGYRRYEISAWCTPGQACRHNLNYWSFGDYLGIGAGAHGKLTDPLNGTITRYWKIRQPEEYMARCPDACAGQRQLGAQDRRFEFLLNALRLDSGFEFDLYTARTGDSAAALLPLLQRHLDDGLLRRDGSRVRTTDLGRRFLDSLLADYLP